MTKPKGSRTCLANHTRSISHHITPLVIHSLGGGHTDTHTHSRIHPHRSDFKKPGARCGRHAPGLKTIKCSHTRARTHTHTDSNNKTTVVKMGEWTHKTHNRYFVSLIHHFTCHLVIIITDKHKLLKISNIIVLNTSQKCSHLDAF